MQGELQQCEESKIWGLGPQQQNHFVIGTNRYLKNLDENRKIMRNKAWLVAQRYNQEEGIWETFAPVAR